MTKNTIACPSVTKWAAATGLALIAVSLAIPTAWTKPRYSRESSLLPLPPVQRSPRLARTTSTSKPIDTSPSLATFDQHLAVEKKKRHIAKAIVVKYIELIAATEPTSPDMPDYLFRLAEAHAQNQRHWRFRAMNLHTEIDRTRGDRRTALVRKQRKYFRVASKAKKAAAASTPNLPKTAGTAIMDVWTKFYSISDTASTKQTVMLSLSKSTIN